MALRDVAARSTRLLPRRSACLLVRLRLLLALCGIAVSYFLFVDIIFYGYAVGLPFESTLVDVINDIRNDRCTW